MNKKHHRAYKQLQKALEKAKKDHAQQAVTIALMATRIEEMRGHLDIDEAAIEKPKVTFRPKGKPRKQNYVRG